MTPAREALQRLQAPKVNYMEIIGFARGFSCGTCQFARILKGRGLCTHRDIQAPVSLSHGCCNLFSDPPNELPPQDWEAFR